MNLRFRREFIYSIRITVSLKRPDDVYCTTNAGKYLSFWGLMIFEAHTELGDCLMFLGKFYLSKDVARIGV